MLERELLFEKLNVATPCPVRWRDLKGDDRARFCQRCRREVYDFGAMSQSEAVELIRAHHRNASTTFFRRDDGCIATADCRPTTWREQLGVFAASSRAVRLFAAVAMLFVLLAGGLVFFARDVQRAFDPLGHYTGPDD